MTVGIPKPVFLAPSFPASVPVRCKTNTMSSTGSKVVHVALRATNGLSQRLESLQRAASSKPAASMPFTGWPRSGIKDQSLENSYQSANGSSGTSSGKFNAGIVVVRHRVDGLQCVEKKMKPAEVVNGRAAYEMAIMRKISHNNIVEFIDAFIDNRGHVPRASIFMTFVCLIKSGLSLWRVSLSWSAECIWTRRAFITQI